MTIKPLLIVLAGFVMTLPCLAQHTLPVEDAPAFLQARFVSKVQSRITSLETKIKKQTSRYLARLKQREAKLLKKIAKKDSLASALVFADAELKYSNLESRLNTPKKYKDFYPYLDTLSSSLRFLDQQQFQFDGHSSQKVKDALLQIQEIETQLDKAEAIKQFLKERWQFLKAQLEKYGLGRQLKQFNKEVYYYSQYVNEYKSLVQNPEKLERKVIEVLSKTSVFQEFLKKHSFLASIFRMPGEPGSPTYQANVAGLQTNSQVTQMIQQQFGTSGPNSIATIQQSIQQAQDQLLQLKNNIANLKTGEDGDAPAFRPNNQKTRSFLNRLEWGANIQTQKATNYFPATSDIGLSLGYKLNDKSVLGVGMSYALGLGDGWRDIQFSSQGVGLRSFLDWKLKGSFWISGGYEMNYRSVFDSVDQLRELNAWQQSGLLGISKVVSMKSKTLKKTKVSLLWDFLSYSQTPHTPAIKFRIGYNFK